MRAIVSILFVSILFMFTLMSSLPAVADDAVAADESVTNQDPPDRGYELELTPNGSYSSWNGLSLGADLSFRLKVDDHWQWEVSAGHKIQKYGNESRVGTGAVYNFSEDWSRSFFVGAGLGFGNGYGLNDHYGIANDKLFGYVKVAKRFALNRSGTITWNPSVSVVNDGTAASALLINPLSIGWSF